MSAAFLVTNNNPILYFFRLEGLFRYIHNGIPVLSHAESKMKKELEDIETYLTFHKESLEQVRQHSSCPPATNATSDKI